MTVSEGHRILQMGTPNMGCLAFSQHPPPPPPPAAHSPPQPISVITPSPPTARGPFKTGLIDRPAGPHPARSQPRTVCGYPSDTRGPFKGTAVCNPAVGGGRWGVSSAGRPAPQSTSTPACPQCPGVSQHEACRLHPVVQLDAA